MRLHRTMAQQPVIRARPAGVRALRMRAVKSALVLLLMGSGVAGVAGVAGAAGAGAIAEVTGVAGAVRATGVVGAASAAGIAAANGFVGPAACATWPAWHNFANTFITDTGRLIDPATPNGQTTSEGQAYALFFALVAGDRERFARVLRWSEDNLAGGDLTARLPAWLWGRKADGSWGIIDDNAAADADLWMAYALQEAGRLWQAPHYTAQGRLLAERILREETAVFDGIGRLLLPAPRGFQTAAGSVRLNPSYAPLQVLRRLAAGSLQPESKAQWLQQVAGTARMLIDSAPRGFAPDWVRYSSAGGFAPDTETQATGSFNAIRTYLWTGMLARDEPLRPTLQKALLPMVRATIAGGTPPLRVDTRSGALDGIGDAGFSAALLPLIAGTVGPNAAALQEARIMARDPLARRDNYYEQALTLFGLGWRSGRYHFVRDGSLLLHGSCNPR